MNSLLLALLVALPAYCGFWNGDPAVTSTVGDSITVSSGAAHSFAASSGFSSWDILHVDRIPEPPCSGKSPLACEYDVTQPRISLIQIGTNDLPEWTETWFVMHNIRDIVQQTIARGILPVLYTLPDNVNKPVAPINEFIRALTVELNIPLVDYHNWMATLPNAGIGIDGVHPSVSGYELRALLTAERLKGIRTTCGW